MIPVTDWFSRKFTFDFPLDVYPAVIERLRGTPARLDERIANYAREILIQRDGEDWSIQEHAGHLLDLSSLDFARLEDFEAGRDVLTTADLTNRKTYEANHHADTISHILSEFRQDRMELVRRLEGFDADIVARTALHPRLQIPMRLVDWAYFVAEHDDHHLAQISVLLRKFT